MVKEAAAVATIKHFRRSAWHVQEAVAPRSRVTSAPASGVDWEDTEEVC